MTPPKRHPRLLEPGWYVAVTERVSSRGDTRCSVGQVQAVTRRGVRLTLIDWLVGAPVSWDCVIPWDNIVGMLVATPEHTVKEFGAVAAAMVARVDGKGEVEAREAYRFWSGGANGRAYEERR